MLFSSPAFFAFFAVYFLVHLVIPRAARILLIIAGSAVFYAWWKAGYVWLPYVLLAVAYVGIFWIDDAADPAQRKRRLLTTIVLLFLPLVFYKYTGFIYRDVLGPVLGLHGRVVDRPLPLGVSFITFTLTAFIVDISRRTFYPKPPLRLAAAYVLFFPHLIAGPILRPVELIPQLAKPRPALNAKLYAGFVIFTIGLTKKLVFADTIAMLVDAAYKANVMSGPAALLALYGFSMQIYCDFSGYTDMAIGLAMMIGVRLPNNFLRPYAATSIIDFWRRWHITLSFWLRDYLYIPMGGNRAGRMRTYVNMVVTMVLGGLWHGANWTFVIWGFLHGLAIVAAHVGRDLLRWIGWKRLPRWLGILITFHLVTLLWMFFRAPTLSKASQMLAAPVSGDWSNPTAYLYANLGPVMLLAIFAALHPFDDYRRIKLVLRRVRPEIVWPLIALLWAVAMTLSQGSSAKFIYFDF